MKSGLGRYALLSVATAAAAVACGGNDLTLPRDRTAAHITVAGGDGQNGTAGAVLRDSVIAKVTDSQNRPIEGQRVDFTVTSGGGTVSPANATTNSIGMAATRWTLGTAAGAQSVKAQANGSGAPANLAISFSATAGAGNATTIAKVRGDNQNATAGSLLPDSLVVLVTDATNNPVPGVTVQWTITGGGAVSAPSSTTGADGRTGVTRTLGSTAGPQTTVATSGSLSGSPLTFNAVATVGSAGELAIVRQPSSGAQSGAAFAQQPQVQLRDQNHNPVATAGIAVSAALSSGPPTGSLVGNATAATNGSGLATFSGLGISGLAGSYTITFTGNNLSGTTSNSININAGTAAGVTLKVAPSGSASSGVPFSQQPQVQLIDAPAGNPVLQSGAHVSIDIVSGSGSLGGATTATTDVNGVATFTNLSLSGSAGVFKLRFFVVGLPRTDTAVVSVGAGSPDGAHSTYALSQSTIAAGGSTTVTVTARDVNDNLIQGAAPAVSVTPSCGPTQPTSPLTDAAGVSVTTITCTLKGNKSVAVAINGIGLTNPPSRTLTVNPATSNTALVAAPTSSTFGQPVTFTATVSGAIGTRTGTVQFRVDGSTAGGPVTLSGGQAQLPTAALDAGTHAITADYSGDGTYDPSNAVIPTFSVAKTNTTTQLAVAPPGGSNFGQSVNLTATVATTFNGGPTPTGNVQFKLDGNDLGSPVALNANGQAAINDGSILPGNHSLTADYAGSSDYNSSSGGVAHSVGLIPTQTNVSSSANPSVFGQGVTFTAHVIAPLAPALVPTGDIQFQIDGAPFGLPVTLNGSGDATSQVAQLPLGTYTITALYTASGVLFAGGSGGLSSVQTVNPAPTAVSKTAGDLATPNPGDPVDLILHVVAPLPSTVVPTGTVDFVITGVDGSGTLSAPNVAVDGSGDARVTFNAISTGTVTINATYNADPNFVGGQTVTFTVNIN